MKREEWGKMTRTILDLVRKHPGKTIWQLWMMTEYKWSSFNPLVHRLARQGRIRKKTDGAYLRIRLYPVQSVDDSKDRIIEEKDRQIARLMREIEKVSVERDHFRQLSYKD